MQILRYIISFWLLIIFSSPHLSAQEFQLKTKPNTKTELISKMDLWQWQNTTKLAHSLNTALVYKPQDLPIFCLIEHKLLKSVNFNVKIRLGDVSYVDKLEGYK